MTTTKKRSDNTENKKIENSTSAALEMAQFLRGVQWAIDTLRAEEFERHADILETISNIKHGTPCDNCGTRIPSDIHAEELGLCLDCALGLCVVATTTEERN